MLGMDTPILSLCVLAALLGGTAGFLGVLGFVRRTRRPPILVASPAGLPASLASSISDAPRGVSLPVAKRVFRFSTSTLPAPKRVLRFPHSPVPAADLVSGSRKPGTRIGAPAQNADCVDIAGAVVGLGLFLLLVVVLGVAGASARPASAESRGGK